MQHAPDSTPRRMKATTVGEARFPSPFSRAVSDDDFLPTRVVVHASGEQAPSGDLFELAGPRAKLFFDPSKSKAAVVTCGGLCPGINNVIRSLFLELYHC